ncbi:interferon-induced very large GTPase 1-like [Hyperolius riggenbachi]|uniref:interferon-induced very large GTPase 1-like n=1 Tax=Hyperolius riggenbachi TaxID=752182 RepID=UPI0035A3A403
MEKYFISKLTLRDILDIGPENLKDQMPEKTEDVPLCTLRKIMALDNTARHTQLITDLSDLELDDLFFSDIFDNSQNQYFIHPLDVLCVLLHCSDSFLQQEIVTKMAMCQFPVPLLLPPGDGSHFTLMLWAMRAIVKKWRPQSLEVNKGFREDSVVNIPMPIISFVRLGKNKLSKSITVNLVLNPQTQQHSFFIHDFMDAGNKERKVSDGLVEISWYFPNGKSDVFPEPVTVTNLRGNLENNWEQFTFLARISSAVFIFVETINEREFHLLSSCSCGDTMFYFVVTPAAGKSVDTQTRTFLLDLLSVLRIGKANVILKNQSNAIQNKILHILNNCQKPVRLEDLQKYLSGHPFETDENKEECQRARECADRITRDIQDVTEYKSKTMILQGDLWKDLSKLEKELCRMEKQGNQDAEAYHSHLRVQMNSLHAKQYHQQMPEGIKLFAEALTHLSGKERQYFLKWMKFKLDAIARDNLLELQAIYKRKCTDVTFNREELKDLDRKIYTSSLGIEHFLRELGQFYEAECSMIKQTLTKECQKKFSNFPGMVAELLLDGFPFELIDGDAFNIPLQWITDVLSELDRKTGGKCKIRVISVLGVQSTGKSTLLNTMFGLQFPVASGRCTQGAFMTLLHVKQDLQKELGCQFILVIDTEGLKAPEQASLEGSYEHDNELATLVVGLSDITIVNMAMENTSEIRDIMQVVVHAFLRMKEIGKKPNCQFVHQNVSDVSAHDSNIKHRRELLQYLDEMTRVSAAMERRNNIFKFTDIIESDLENDSWYIPGLWQGVPPMASINLGYSSCVLELKTNLLKHIQIHNHTDMPLSIREFIIWIESLWRFVKYERFIFSFRNSLVAKAYNEFSAQYSLWELHFCKRICEWLISTDISIKNQSGEIYDVVDIRELQDILQEEENKMMASLQKYFETSKHANLLERYREDFTVSIKCLKMELERNALSKCDKAASIQRGKIKLQNIQKTCQTLVEEKIRNLLETCKESTYEASEQVIKQEFESTWLKTLSDLPFEKQRRVNVEQSILQILKADMSKKAPYVNETLLKVRGLYKYAKKPFTLNKKDIDFFTLRDLTLYRPALHDISDLAVSIIGMCDEYVKEKVSSIEDYDKTYSKELLHMINTKLDSEEAKKLPYTAQFELDVKLHILGNASQLFQSLHDQFIQKNDPRFCLEKLKPQYLSTFLSIIHRKDDCQRRVLSFYKYCLKPAISNYVFKHLGQKMLDEFLSESENVPFQSRSFFQYSVLQELLEEMSFEKYLEYLNSYESFVKKWVLVYITNKCHGTSALGDLLKNILSSIVKKIKATLKNETCLKCKSLPSLLEQFCEMLKTDLVIPQNELKVITFHNFGKVEEFASEVEQHLPEIEQQIQTKLSLIDMQTLLSRVTVQPQHELFKKVIGCGMQCPFCKVSCDAGGGYHSQHFAFVHRPQGLVRESSRYKDSLDTSICSTTVTSNTHFKNEDTNWEWHPYKEYRTIYPHWIIQPDTSIESSDYWKFVFVSFNEQFAKEYDATPSALIESWKLITKEKAKESIRHHGYKPTVKYGAFQKYNQSGPSLETANAQRRPECKLCGKPQDVDVVVVPISLEKSFRLDLKSAGLYRCQKTGIKFQVKCPMSIKYELSSWSDYMNQMPSADYEALGPLFQIHMDNDNQMVSAVYLPHYLCLQRKSYTSKPHEYLFKVCTVHFPDFFCPFSA